MPAWDRRSARDEPMHPAVEYDDGIWRIRSYAAARQILTARDATTQAGFTSEYIPQGVFQHHPILFSDGELHDEQRRKVGRFFALRVVNEQYLPHMERAAEQLVSRAVADGGTLVDDLALFYSVEVTRQVVGLTESPTVAMSRRLEGFFRQPPFDLTKPLLGRTRKQWLQAGYHGIRPVVAFYLHDVLPAIRARRGHPRDDVVSHLIEEGYTRIDILVECCTYGTAGMITTREFIAMTLWHLLTNPALQQRYQAAERPERLAMLEELIRLEPVVGHMYRRMQQDLHLDDGVTTHWLRQDDLVDICIAPANLDGQAFESPQQFCPVRTPGAPGTDHPRDPDATCPGRDLPRGVHPAGLSFADGAHRCPGQPLAMLETDVIVRRLLAENPGVVSEPDVSWDDFVAGYTLRGFTLEFA